MVSASQRQHSYVGDLESQQSSRPLLSKQNHQQCPPDPFDSNGPLATFCLIAPFSAFLLTVTYWSFEGMIMACQVCEPPISDIAYISAVFVTFGLPSIWGIFMATGIIYCISYYRQSIKCVKLPVYVTVGCVYGILMGLAFVIAGLQWAYKVCPAHAAAAMATATNASTQDSMANATAVGLRLSVQ